MELEVIHAHASCCEACPSSSVAPLPIPVAACVRRIGKERCDAPWQVRLFDPCMARGIDVEKSRPCIGWNLAIRVHPDHRGNVVAKCHHDGEITPGIFMLWEVGMLIPELKGRPKTSLRAGSCVSKMGTTPTPESFCT